MSRSLVIHNPSLQSLRQKYVSRVLTFVFWLLWFFLWIPLITLIGWVAGIDIFYLEMIELEGYQEVIAEFSLFLLGVTGIGGLLGIWALYNFQRFKNVERRAAINPVNNQQLAAFFQIGESTLADLQKTRCFSLDFDPEGKIVGHEKIGS